MSFNLSSFARCVADLDHTLAVNRRGSLHRETEIGIEIAIETGKEIVIVTEIVNEIEIVIYCLDIDRQSDHLPGTCSIISLFIVKKTSFQIHLKYIEYTNIANDFLDFKERGIAREIERDHASLEMDTALIMAIHRLTIINHSVIVSVIYRLERDRCRDIL